MTKETKKWLAVGGVAYVLWRYALKYLYAVRRLLFRPDSFMVTSVQGSTLGLRFYVRCRNATNVTLDIDGFFGQLFLNEVAVSDVTLQPLCIMPQQDTMIVLDAHLNLQNVGEEVKEQIVNAEAITFDVRLKGTLVMPLKFLNTPYSLDIPIDTYLYKQS